MLRNVIYLSVSPELSHIDVDNTLFVLQFVFDVL